MSSKTKKQSPPKRRPGSLKPERYIQPSILMALTGGLNYGYELIQIISEYGFIEGPAPPGMIYRHLRDLEENGLVSSEWQTAGSGPAKRVYELTPEGMEVLGYWVVYMQNQAGKLLSFIDRYEAARK